MQSGEAWGRQQLHTSRFSRFVEKVFSEKIHLLQLQPKYIGLTNLRSCRSASPNAVWNIYHMRYMVHWVILRYILCAVYAQVTTCAIDKISQSLHWPIVNYEHLPQSIGNTVQTLQIIGTCLWPQICCGFAACCIFSVALGGWRGGGFRICKSIS